MRISKRAVPKQCGHDRKSTRGQYFGNFQWVDHFQAYGLWTFGLKNEYNSSKVHVSLEARVPHPDWPGLHRHTLHTSVVLGLPPNSTEQKKYEQVQKHNPIVGVPESNGYYRNINTCNLPAIIGSFWNMSTPAFDSQVGVRAQTLHCKHVVDINIPSSSIL